MLSLTIDTNGLFVVEKVDGFSSTKNYQFHWLIPIILTLEGFNTVIEVLIQSFDYDTRLPQTQSVIGAVF